MFLNPNISFPIRILIDLIYLIWETSRNKLEKHSVTKNCSNLALFEQILLVVSKFSITKIHSLSRQFCTIFIFLTKPFQPSQRSFFEKGINVQNFLLSEWVLEFFFLTVGQNNTKYQNLNFQKENDY